MDLFGDALRDYHVGARGRMLTIRRDHDHTDAYDLGLYCAADPFSHEAELLSSAHTGRSRKARSLQSSIGEANLV